MPIRGIARTGRRGGPETYRCIVASFPRRGSGASPQNLRPMRMPSRTVPRIKVSILSTLPTCIPCRHGRRRQGRPGAMRAPGCSARRATASSGGQGSRCRPGFELDPGRLAQFQPGKPAAGTRWLAASAPDRLRRSLSAVLAGARPVVEINQFAGMEIAASRMSTILELHHDDGQQYTLARWAQRYRRI